MKGLPNLQPLKLFAALLIAGTTGATLPALASNDPRWALCSDPDFFFPLTPTAIAEQISNKPPQGEDMFVSADQVEMVSEHISKLIGNVLIEKTNELITADTAHYDAKAGRLALSGSVLVWNPDMRMRSDQLIAFTGEQQTGTFEQAHYFIDKSHATGTADKIIRNSDNTTILNNASYTTCSPDDMDWLFRAKQIKLNHNTGIGTAKHMRLRFKGVPIFYFPGFSFPIDDRRKSGFLVPSIEDSDRRGVTLSLPYYWNIAPQADATITPHNMSRRGLKLDTEWRYLNRWSRSTLNTEFLDDKAPGPDIDNKRWLYQIGHQGRLDSHWQTRIDASAVSDAEYFDDFSNSLSTASVSHLPRDARLTGTWPHWSFQTRVLTYETVDDAIPSNSRPYRLLPTFTLAGNYPELWRNMDIDIHSSFTRFDHAERITADRFDLRSRLSWPIGAAGWFVTPAISARHTQYRLDNFSDPSQPDDIDRSVPSFSLDSGLFFERSFGSEQRFLQTLEPRLFLLKTPFREQNDIPVFDTRQPDFNFAQLFVENRFVGADRVGDAEQLSLALSSRILQRSSGAEVLRASIGQIYFNKDRRVTLAANGATIEEDRSDIIAEIKYNFSRHWSTTFTAEWNPERRETDKELFRLRYQAGDNRLLNLAYRLRRDQLKQADASFSWPISKRWSAVGRWNYDIENEVDLERFFGLEYESCCYALRIVSREYITDDNSTLNNGIADDFETDRGIYFQLSLKGFGGLGQNLGQLLEKDILGYKDPY